MISSTEIGNEHPVLDSNNMISNRAARKRTSRTGDGELERVVPNVPATKRRKMKCVSWASKNHTQIQPDYRKLFKDYNDEDVWYTRRDYEKFLIDRLRTIELLRASGGDERALNKKDYCVRGLEPFQTRLIHEELHTNRKFHQSTILLEQVRQSLYGLRNPERFRAMVGPQSEVASRRARELAAMDEHDVYGSVRRRGSLLSTMKAVKGELNSSYPNIDFGTSASEPMSLAERIRQLQESNARRLLEIYSQPGCNLFRFHIRRDSLIGCDSMTRTAMNSPLFAANHLPVRQDSLAPVISNAKW